MADTFDVAALRRRFPSLDVPQIYFDNAGGSQTLGDVAEAIKTYLMSNNVQLGATYAVSKLSTDSYYQGCRAVATYMNASPEEVVIGPSTTQLFRNLSFALYEHLTPGSEIILSKFDHEANVAPWLQMAGWRNLTVKWWDAADRANPKLEPSILRGLMTDKTRLVACTHTSNVLGSISDIEAIAEVVHSFKEAFLCVDAVAYAPHRQIDVKRLGVDFYSFSWYKVYGPHVASLYASKSTHASLSSLGHYFKTGGSLEDTLGLAAASYELTASIPRVCDYLSGVPWLQIAAHEEKLSSILISYLGSRSDIQLWGEPVADAAKRVPVISFTVDGRRSREVVEAIEKRSDFGLRWGSFYSNRLVGEVLKLDDSDGVIRVSLAHYNTESEVRSFLDVLDEVIKGAK